MMTLDNENAMIENGDNFNWVGVVSVDFGFSVISLHWKHQYNSQERRSNVCKTMKKRAYNTWLQPTQIHNILIRLSVARKDVEYGRIMIRTILFI